MKDKIRFLFIWMFLLGIFATCEDDLDTSLFCGLICLGCLVYKGLNDDKNIKR